MVRVWEHESSHKDRSTRACACVHPCKRGLGIRDEKNASYYFSALPYYQPNKSHETDSFVGNRA